MQMLIVLNVQYHQNLKNDVVKAVFVVVVLYDKGRNSRKKPQSELQDTILFCYLKFSIAFS